MPTRQRTLATTAACAALLLVCPPPATGQSPSDCPDCNPPKRFWAGAGELMAVQFVPWFVTKTVRDGEWADISTKTWVDNLKYPWQWDNNKFNNNQFAHPYHGSLYFNAGRANGYNFWESDAVGVRRQSHVGVVRRGLGPFAQRSREHDARRDHAGGDALAVLLPRARQPGDRQQPARREVGATADQPGPRIQSARPGGDGSDFGEPAGLATQHHPGRHGCRVIATYPADLPGSGESSTRTRCSSASPVSTATSLPISVRRRSRPFSSPARCRAVPTTARRFRSFGSEATWPPGR